MAVEKVGVVVVCVCVYMCLMEQIFEKLIW